MESNRFIGGVFAIEQQNVSRSYQSVWTRWAENAKAQYLFHNARSVFTYLVTQIRPSRLWLPAYCCQQISQLSNRLDTAVSFYPVDEQLRPNIEFLYNCLRADDAVLVINYFGRCQSESLKRFVRSTKSVTWIEDCAQALALEGDPLGDFRVYSPRKLLGVPDGGVLVDYGGQLKVPALDPLTDEKIFLRPGELRARFSGEGRNDLWYPAFRAAEASMRVSQSQASTITMNVLLATDIDNLAIARRKNYIFLLEHLENLAFIKEKPVDWVPLGFPIAVNEQDKVLEHLHSRGIFASCHWKYLDAPKDKFSQEHKLANSLITLPCDQRYDIQDMGRIVSELELIA